MTYVRCCVAGGGPAGMMLGLLLARSGVEVLVLEKHADFLRDFRGDTLHPSTLEVMDELGLLADLLRLPHAEAGQISAQIGDVKLPFADFTHLPTRCRFLVFMPQWDFLNFLAEHAGRYPRFTLRMRAEVTELIEDAGRITGLRATTPEGRLEVRADLVVGADGRHSRTRTAAGLEVREFGAPMDVLWFRLSRRDTDPAETMGRFYPGGLLVMIDRGEYWQCGLVILKGAHEEIRRRGLPAFCDELARVAPLTGDRAGELRNWEMIRLLSVQVDRLSRWFRPGLLCIGDAAHAMSPVGGVGINLAIQDAVAAARILAAPLRQGRVTETDLRRVQRRRELPTRVTQHLQLLVQNRVIERVLGSTQRLSPPLALRLLAGIPWLRRLLARVIGLGIRPEHVG